MASENGQVRKNLIFNVLSLVANIGVGVFYTPYLVKSLGLVAYGIIPLALIINQYISVVTGSLTSSLTRFYSIALQKNDKENASKYLSTSLLLMIGIVSVLVLPLWYFVEHIDQIFTIPSELLSEAKLLFTFTIFSFYCSLFSSVFNITLYAFNRLDLLNVTKIIRVTGKLIFVVLLFSMLDTNIAYVGLANLITEVALLIYSFFVFYKFSQGKVNLTLKKFNKSALKAIGFMAFWVIVQQLGDTGLYRIDTFIVNVFWSSKESGILGALTELGNYIMIIASVVGSLFGPLILIAYSKDEHAKVQEISLDNSLILGVLVSVLVGVLIGFSPFILKLWVGEEFVPFSNWLTLKLALIPFYSAAGVFAFASRAWNKVKFPALTTIVLGGINLGILYLLAKYSGNNQYYIDYMLGCALFLGILQSYFLNGLYFAKIYPGNRKNVFIIFLKISSVLIMVSLISSMCMNLINGLSLFVMIIAIFSLSILLLFFSIFFMLNKRQLNSLVSFVKK
ncbi:oligosaccharide flippase family protein [Myroides sp. C15-4]|uniref:oligosaccharide flippase family protein n=1 Tax=Myroides sp. C15-4 TaxID=3400532 RepID=UPI003D2F8073